MTHSVYVLSLPHRTDRLARLSARLPDGYVVRRPAGNFYGVELSPRRYVVYPSYSRPVTLGAVGCTLAHVAAWTDFYVRGEPRTVILEDDAVLPSNFTDYVNFASCLSADADLVYFGRLVNRHDGPVLYTSGELHSYRPAVSWQSHAYLLTRRGAEVLLGYGVPDAVIPVDELLSAACGWPVDDSALRRFPPKLSALAISPEMVQLGDTGDIARSPVSARTGSAARCVETTPDGRRIYKIV